MLVLFSMDLAKKDLCIKFPISAGYKYYTYDSKPNLTIISRSALRSRI